ncbi:MAG TPA: APC family permease [Terriglobales bacterium]|jgi:amino acid transporter|nr:APC family permease [Terriglobales bacterium]
MALLDVLFGRPLASIEDQGQRITPAQGIPTFGLDALSSAAYGPEAALTVLLPLGLAGVRYILPLTGAIIVLLIIVYFSYRQTIAAYPTGGGSYTVAKENLGRRAGLLAAAALMIDYLLNVAVGISAGVGALVSAVPFLQKYTLALCLVILAILTIVNLRGVREAGSAFIAPTYLFVGTLGIVILVGLYRVVAAGGHPHALVEPPHLPAATGAIGLWLLLRAFASGCTALTGVEAVSNGVQAFREPVVPAARKTLTTIVAILIALLAGIASLVHYYGITATDPGQPGYQSVLAMLTAAVAGKGVFYASTMFSVLLVLCLSANTSFADFPRLCRAVALDDYMPHALAARGRRLVYSEGIWALAIFAAALLILFGGVTDRLIPLFAVGAFLAFTLSQAGMVAHWRRTARGAQAIHSILINGLGAGATGITVVVVLAAKFTQGAWVVVLLLPAALILMAWVHRHYHQVLRELQAVEKQLAHKPQPPVVIVPMERWNAATQKALRFAMTLSPEVQAVHVTCEGDDSILSEWQNVVERPAREVGIPVPKLVTVHSPYRLVLKPVIEHVLKVERENRHRMVAVVVAVMVERHWYHYFLHNQRGAVLTALLLLRGERRINIINVPWYLQA